MRILAEVGSRNDKGMKGHLDHLATRYPGNQDMTRFMHDLHREPRKSNEGYNQQNLWKPLHYSLLAPAGLPLVPLQFMQSILHFFADRNHNVVVVLAHKPAELFLDNVEFETVAIGNDGLNVSDAAVPNR